MTRYIVIVTSHGETRKYEFTEYVLARIFIQSLAPGTTYELDIIPKAS